MFKWLIQIEGNDTFFYDYEIDADSFGPAVVDAQNKMESLQKSNIEKLDIVAIIQIHRNEPTPVKV